MFFPKDDPCASQSMTDTLEQLMCSYHRCGLLLSDRLRIGLLLGWLVGAAVSLAAIALSYGWDLPTGAAIVCTFGITLLLIAVLKRFIVG